MTDLVEDVARALSIPQHHTTWELLSAVDKSLFFMQADYAIGTIGPSIIEALDLLVRVVNVDHPDAAIAITNASILRDELSAASGIETEGHDGATRLGAEHESPVPKGDAQ